jgi:hypothetical protein
MPLSNKSEANYPLLSLAGDSYRLPLAWGELMILLETPSIKNMSKKAHVKKKVLWENYAGICDERQRKSHFDGEVGSRRSH